MKIFILLTTICSHTALAGQINVQKRLIYRTGFNSYASDIKVSAPTKIEKANDFEKSYLKWIENYDINIDQLNNMVYDAMYEFNLEYMTQDDCHD